MSEQQMHDHGRRISALEAWRDRHEGLHDMLQLSLARVEGAAAVVKWVTAVLVAPAMLAILAAVLKFLFGG